MIQFIYLYINNMQKSGTWRIRILSLNINSDSSLIKDYLISIGNGKQRSNISSNQNLSKILWFDNTANNFEITIANKNLQSLEIGYAELQVAQLLKFPKNVHKIEVHLSAKLYEKWLEKQTGILLIQLLYFPKTLTGTLNITIINANLIRDTEEVTQMDPYVRIKYDGKQFKTTTKHEAGKKPIWNQKFKINIQKLSDYIEFNVLDQDVTVDDLVGSVRYRLRDSPFLHTNKKIEHNLRLTYTINQKQIIDAGFLKFTTQFIPTS